MLDSIRHQLMGGVLSQRWLLRVFLCSSLVLGVLLYTSRGTSGEKNSQSGEKNSQSGEKDWDEGLACIAAYNKSLTSSGRKVFIDRRGVEILCSLLKPSTRVLEYGSGASTAFFSEFVDEWVSVEHHKDWEERVRLMVGPLPWAKKVTLLLAEPDIPYCDDCGTPPFPGAPQEGTEEQFRSYIDAPKKLGKKFDIILDDGRARVGVAKAAFELLAEDGRLVIHDWERPYYKEGAKSLGYILEKEVKEERHLGVLVPPKER